MMNDVDDIIALVKSYYKVIIGILVIVVMYLLIWFFRGYGGNPEVKKTVDGITSTAQQNAKRVDVIIDAAKTKEEEVKRDVIEKVDAVSDDKLPDLLAGLLADYRKSR